MLTKASRSEGSRRDTYDVMHWAKNAPRKVNPEDPGCLDDGSHKPPARARDTAVANEKDPCGDKPYDVTPVHACSN